MPKLNTSISPATEVTTRRQLLFVAIGDLIPDSHNPRKHGRAQISAIARSIEAFGFNAPILVDRNNKIVAGHGRYEAAMLLGIDKVPVVLRLRSRLRNCPTLCSTLTSRRSDLSHPKSICEFNRWILH